MFEGGGDMAYHAENLVHGKIVRSDPTITITVSP